ncbi:hypothetical protein [Cedecea sp. NFIX57]|uniref:hypothetical protein n=1 Tax=Cedecea sp. NFIX57 TaxID=1566286 RepID=UPI0020CAC871|nr:hypothetical protein [Cedecea sp. NFIX57]
MSTYPDAVRERKRETKLPGAAKLQLLLCAEPGHKNLFNLRHLPRVDCQPATLSPVCHLACAQV